MKLRSLLLFVWLLNGLPASAQPTAYSKAVQEKIRQVENHLAADVRLPQDNDWNIQERMQYYHVPGLSVAVIHNYQIEWAKAYGWADIDQQKPLTTQTRFQAGYLSQALNAIGILTLVQDKKIDLYADINQYLTTWKFPYDSVAKGKKITTANLLSHTAGLPFIRFSGYGVGSSLPSLVQILNGQHPANTPAVRSRFEPGVKYQYSGGGIIISQQMLIDVTRQPYNQYISERVLKPMGMVNSSFTQPPSKSSPLATGYDLENNEIAGKYLLFPEQAAAGLWTTPTDWARYIVETQLAYQGKSSNVLTAQMTRLRLRAYVDSSMALGVRLLKKGPNLYFTNEGYGAGFSSLYYGSLTNGDGLVIMVNSDNGGVNIIGELANSISRVYNWPDFYQPTLRSSVAVPDSVLESYVGDYQLGSTVLSFTKDKGRFFNHIKGTNRAELIAETSTKFFFLNIDADFEFIKDDKGQVVKVTMVYGGQKTEWNKVH